MIRHIVLLRFRQDVSEATVASIFDDVHAMRDVVPGIKAVVSGRSESPEKIERGYMHGFVVDFDDWAALEVYQKHPAHQQLASRLVEQTQGGVDGVLVFDLPVL